jgi:hypothetical protein
MASAVEFRPGDRVTVRQHGTWKFGNLVLKNNTFVGVTITRRNDDGSYQVKGILKRPETDEVTVPAEWIEPA